MRLTRAALRAEATPNLLPNDAADASTVPLPPSPSKERVPLSGVSANPLNEQPTTTMAPATETKAKGGRKGAKGANGKKSKKAEPESGTTEAEQVEVLEDERKAAASPASDAAINDLTKVGANGIVQVPMNDERPASPPSRAVRMTRRQLAKVETQTPNPKPFLSTPRPESAQESHEHMASPEKTVPQSSQEETTPVTTNEAADVVDATQYQPETLQPVLSPKPASADDLEPKVLAAEKLCEQEGTTPRRTPSGSPARTPMRLEESIEAIDALEEAIEQVGKAIPLFDHESDEKKSPQKTHFNPRTTPGRRAKGVTMGTANKTRPPAAPRLSRNPIVPRSLKPTASAVNASRVRDSSTYTPSLAHSVRNRAPPAKGSGVGKGRTGPGETSDYLASKRRPISMSFPAPPPPARSTKPPTKSTFQLPGEAVAAKLKAQKEERLKREEEEAAAAAKKANFKARPAPAVRKASVPVKQTTASKARENMLQRVKLGPTTAPAAPLRSSSLSLAPNGKRQSTVLSSSRPTVTPSVASNRVVHIANPGPLTKSTVTAADVATQRVKAREIFNRDKLEKEQKESERKEKEAAAMRARAEAAERGRIASREWAEKQKLKKMSTTAAVAAKAAM